jgi:hypothetical protein
MHLPVVMAGLVPAIREPHLAGSARGVDTRATPGTARKGRPPGAGHDDKFLGWGAT